MIRARGLYKNGRFWWLRVSRPGATPVPNSTGTDELKLANRIAAMVEGMREERSSWDLLDAVAARTLSLRELYDHTAAGTLHLLRQERAAQAGDTADPDIEPLVASWERDYLPTRDISERQVGDYVRQVRVLVPAGRPFRASSFTEDTIMAALRRLDCSSSTKRRHTTAWRLFYRFARKKAPLPPNPFADADWLPANGSPRSIWWDHETRVRVLSLVTDEQWRVALTLVFGSGIEHSALAAMTAGHVGRDRTIVAPGSKNEHREDRTIFVDAWAWPVVRAWADRRRSYEPLFDLVPSRGGQELRDALYAAQVAAELVPAPSMNGKTRKPLWGQVEGLHTVHDARHTYGFCRLLGLDGEARQDLKFIAMQFGHADEQMGMRIYTKANIATRLRLLELEEARRKAQPKLEVA